MFCFLPINSGGILGLFTGMSLLSICEIVFWTGRIATSMMAPGTKTRAKKKKLRKELHRQQ